MLMMICNYSEILKAYYTISRSHRELSHGPSIRRGIVFRRPSLRRKIQRPITSIIKSSELSQSFRAEVEPRCLTANQDFGNTGKYGYRDHDVSLIVLLNYTLELCCYHDNVQ